MTTRNRIAITAKRARARKPFTSIRSSSVRYMLVGAMGACVGMATTSAQDTELPTITVSGEREDGLNLDKPSSTGSRLGLTPRETPASVASISSADIVERNLTRAQDAAIRLPGVTESPAPGNGGTSLVARGFAGHNSVAQLVDGTRLVVASGTITYPFSTWPLESVEVLSGPASVLYGDGSIGAAVNYVTKKPLFDRTEREAMFGIDNYGGIQAGIGLRGPVNDTVAYSLYLDNDKTDGYRSDQAHERTNLSTAIALRPDRDLNITFMLDAGHNDDSRYYGTPLINGKLDDRLRKTSFNVDDAFIKYNDQVWRARVEYQLSDDIKLRNETYYMTSKRHWKNTETYTANPSGMVTRSSYLEILHDQEQIGDRFDATVDGHIGGLKNRFVAGLEWYRTRLQHTSNGTAPNTSVINPFDFDPGQYMSSTSLVPNRYSKLENKAVFAENVLDLTKNLKLVAGLRHEQMELNNLNQRDGNIRLIKDYAPTTGRIGTVWSAGDALTLYGQYGTGTDPLSGSLSLPGNGNVFDLTKGKQIEVGAKGNLPSIKGEWTVALYKIEKRNLLVPDADNPSISQQVGQQSSKGIELGLSTEPVRGLTVEGNVAFLRARYDDFAEKVGTAAISRDGNKVSGVPERTANLWTSYRFTPQWQAGVGARYVGERQSNAANTASLPSYSVFDAIVNCAITRDTTLSLSVRNLTNRDYALSGSGNVRWLLGEPRTAQLTARTSF